MSAGGTGDDSPAHGREERLRRTLLFYWTPLWLLGLAVLLGALALYLYPRDPPVSPQYALQGIGVAATFTPSAIVVYQTPDPQIDGFILSVDLHAKAPVRPYGGSVDINLPPRAWGTKGTCRPPAKCHIDPTTGLKIAQYVLTMPWTKAGRHELGAYGYELHLFITVSHVGSNLSRNNEYVSVLTPPTQFQLNSQKPSSVYTEFAEWVPGGDVYSWTTGAVPVYLNGFERWSAASATSIESGTSPTLDSGTDLAVQNTNGNLQFIAGIAVGAAGGALVGAVQEWLNRRRREEEGGAAPA